MAHDLSHEFKTLFETPFDHLALAPQTLRVLEWHAIRSLGDCLVFYVNDVNGQDLRPPKLKALMYGEVFQALVAGGCWHILESGTMWQQFQPISRFVGLTHLGQQSTKQDLYTITLDALTLPVPFHNRLTRLGMTTVGDCVDFYWHVRLSEGMALHPFSLADYDELEARLMDLDCWTLIAEQYDEW